jgi:ATP synthase protein I
MQQLSKAMRTQAYRWLMWQAIALILAVLLLGWMYGIQTGYSVLAGGAIAVLANAFFARILFSVKKGGDPRDVLRRFYRAEIGKIVISVVMLCLAIRYFPLAFLPFFTSYAVTLVSLWLTLLTHSSNFGIKREP